MRSEPGSRIGARMAKDMGRSTGASVPPKRLKC